MDQKMTKGQLKELALEARRAWWHRMRVIDHSNKQQVRQILEERYIGPFDGIDHPPHDPDGLRVPMEKWPPIPAIDVQFYPGITQWSDFDSPTLRVCPVRFWNPGPIIIGCTAVLLAKAIYKGRPQEHSPPPKVNIHTRFQCYLCHRNPWEPECIVSVWVKLTGEKYRDQPHADVRKEKHGDR